MSDTSLKKIEKLKRFSGFEIFYEYILNSVAETRRIKYDSMGFSLGSEYRRGA